MKFRGLEIIINIVFFSLSAWFITTGFSIESQEIEISNGVKKIITIRDDSLIVRLWVCIGISMILFYTNLFNLKKLVNSHQKARVIVSSGLILVISFLAFYIFNKIAFGEIITSLPTYLGFAILIFYFTISTAYGLGKVILEGEKNQRKLLVDKKQAELNLIRNQLQPHFLFNAMNNFLSMVDQKKSPLLADSFDRLSQLLRYVIEETTAEKVSIKKEIEFIQNYAALHLLRFEPDEINFKLAIEGEYQNQYIEPGIFIPFVENAFKYGTEPEKLSEIDTTFDLSKKDVIQFKIKNSISSFSQHTESTGIGIKATQERLQLVYPNKHHLKILNQDGYYIVELLIHTK